MVAAVMVIDAFSCGVAAGSRSSAVKQRRFAAADAAQPGIDDHRVSAMFFKECGNRGLARARGQRPERRRQLLLALPSRHRRAGAGHFPGSSRARTSASAPRAAVPRGRTSRAGSVSAFFTSSMSSRSSPSSVHSACSRTRSSGDDVASLTSAGATVTSPRSTSIRCAVSRHQPLACERRLTSCAEVSGLAGAGAAGRVESWTMR